MMKKIRSNTIWCIIPFIYELQVQVKLFYLYKKDFTLLAGKGQVVFISYTRETENGIVTNSVADYAILDRFLPI